VSSPVEIYSYIADKRAALGAKAFTVDELFRLFKLIDEFYSEAANQDTETDECIRSLVEYVHHQRTMLTN
jgi:hypothetical protein